MDVGNVADVSAVISTSIIRVYTVLRPKIGTDTVSPARHVHYLT
jgi:hypothetical protein